MNLNEVYPIGTICKINGYSELIMITGYLKNISDKGQKRYDYEGCFYPYGTLTNVKIFFNEKEIIEIICDGYKLSNKLEVVKKIDDDLCEEKVYIDEDMFFVKNKSYDQLLFDKEGKVLIAEEKKD